MWVNGDHRISSDMLSENVVQEYLCGRYACIYVPRTYTNRYKASFLPSALSVFNENDTSY